jgi:hypothetical protein
MRDLDAFCRSTIEGLTGEEIAALRECENVSGTVKLTGAAMLLEGAAVSA